MKDSSMKNAPTFTLHFSIMNNLLEKKATCIKSPSPQIPCSDATKKQFVRYQKLSC